MKIGILVSNIGNFGTKGLYNSQEIGMAKALRRSGNEVTIYKLEKNKNSKSMKVEKIEKGIVVTYISVKSIGTHGLSNLRELDRNLDILIHFSDIQLIFRKVYIWCKKNNVKLIPYIGVLKSNSDNKIKRSITNLLSKRNISLYKTCSVLAKTPYVENQLLEYGVEQVDILPVGLDMDLLNKDYFLTDKNDLRKKYQLSRTDTILLFIGRLDEEKRPIEAIEILNSLNKISKIYKLILVGKGKLKTKVFNKIDEYKLNDSIIYIESIPNNKIWELYHLSDYFINLNINEIFGMAILEAMYYKCCVIARNAPGPDYILRNNISGFIVTDYRNVTNIISSSDNNINIIEENAYNEVISRFTWGKISSVLK